MSHASTQLLEGRAEGASSENTLVRWQAQPSPAARDGHGEQEEAEAQRDPEVRSDGLIVHRRVGSSCPELIGMCATCSSIRTKDLEAELDGLKERITQLTQDIKQAADAEMPIKNDRTQAEQELKRLQTALQAQESKARLLFMPWTRCC